MPVRGGGGIKAGGRPKRGKGGSVGAAIQSAGAPLKPKPKPKRGGGKAVVGSGVQAAGKPLARPEYKLPKGRRGDAPQTRKQDARKAAQYNRSKAGKRSRAEVREQERKVALLAGMLTAADAARHSRVQRVNPGTVEAVGTAVGQEILGRAPTGTTGVRAQARGRARSRVVLAPRARKEAARAVVRELEGSGDLAKLSRRAGKFVREKGVGVQTGGGPAGVLARRKGKGSTGRLAAAQPYRLRDAKYVARAIDDLIQVPASVIPSVFVPARAGVKAAQGDTREARAYIEGIKRDDPFYPLLEGDAKESLRRIGEHPGFAALEAWGIGKAVSRGGGRTVRGTGRAVKGAGRATRSSTVQRAGERIRRVGAVETRPNAAIPATALEVDRRYSRGLVGKGTQVATDRARTKRANRLREEAKRVEKRDPRRAAELRRSAAKADPRIASSRDIKRRVDVAEMANEAGRVRRVGERDNAVGELLGYGPTSKAARNVSRRARRRPADAGRAEQGAAMSLIAQNIVKPTVADLKAYKTELEAQFNSLVDPRKRKANQELRRQIDQSIRAEKKKPGTLKQSAERARRFSEEVDRPLDGVLEELGLIEQGRADRAKLVPYAARNMSARVDTRKTKADVAESRKALDKAKRAADSAERTYRNAVQQRAVRQGRAEVLSRNVAGRGAEDAAIRAGNPRARAEGRYAGGGIGVDRADKAIQQTAVARDRAAERYAKVREAHDEVVRLSRQRVLVDGDRNLLTDDAIRDHMRRNGMDVEPSYVSQAPNATSAGSYYRSSYQEPVIPDRKRTESPTLEGTFDASPEALRSRALKAENLATAAINYRRTIGDIGVRGDDGDLWTTMRRDAADERAATLSENTGVRYQVVRVKPWGVSRQQFEAMLDDINEVGDSRGYQSFNAEIADALNGKGEGPFAIVPTTAARRLREHANVLNPNDFEKAAQAVRASFSRTVLSLSPSPTVGNAVESGFRAAIARSGPISRYTYERTMRALRKLDPEAAKRLEDTLLGSGHITVSTRARHFEPDQLDEGGMRKTAAALEAARRAPVGKQASAVWRAWTTFVFEVVNHYGIERPTQKTMAGKAIRDRGLMSDRVLGLSAKAFDEAAEGLRGTAAQVDLADALVDMYGKYRGFSPQTRYIIATYSPFLAWYINSVRFVGVVLPRDHPVLTALTAQAIQVADDVDREAKRPGWLRGTMASGGVQWQATRNTPFGAFTDPAATLGGLFMPQFTPLVTVLRQGEDWKGKKLRNEDGSPFTFPQTVGYTFGELAASMIPAYAIADRGITYGKNPGGLLNAVRVKPSTDGAQATDTPRVKSKAARSAASRGSDSDVVVIDDPEMDRLWREAELWEQTTTP